MSWSNDLLSEAEQRLLGRLSVLRGGFDLDMAERVAGGEPLAPEAIAGLLASLAGKSLVQIQAGVTVRYSLLETVRQFAAGRLAASGEETAVHARLLGWALGVARSAEAAPPGPGGRAGPAGWRPDRPVSAPRCPGRWAAPSRRRDGNWPPGSPGGGSLPAGTAKRASS